MVKRYRRLFGIGWHEDVPASRSTGPGEDAADDIARRQGAPRGWFSALLAKLKFVAQLTWTVCIVGLGVTIGGMLGWESHGWLGAIGFGFLGFGVGAVFAASPMFFLQVLRGFT